MRSSSPGDSRSPPESWALRSGRTARSTPRNSASPRRTSKARFLRREDSRKAIWSLYGVGRSEIISGSDAGWSSLAARRAHNPKVIGSNPIPATRLFRQVRSQVAGLLFNNSQPIGVGARCGRLMHLVACNLLVHAVFSSTSFTLRSRMKYKQYQAEIKLKSLILAQIERWRHALHMQVERQRGGNPGGERRTGE